MSGGEGWIRTNIVQELSIGPNSRFQTSTRETTKSPFAFVVTGGMLAAINVIPLMNCTFNCLAEKC